MIVSFAMLALLAFNSLTVAVSSNDAPNGEAALEQDAISPPEGISRQLVNGLLLARNGQGRASTRVLDSYVKQGDHIGSGLSTALRQLAWNAALIGDYRTAYTYGARYVAAPVKRSSDDLTAFANELATWKILAGQPRMRVAFVRAAPIPIHHNAGGRLEGVVSTSDVQALALIDTGAEQCVISASLAKRLALHSLPGTIADAGATGGVTIARMAVLPKLRLGGAQVSNVPVEVMPDALLTFGSGKAAEKVDIIVGYAVLRRTTALRIFDAQYMMFGPTSMPAGWPTQVVLLEEGFQPFARATVLDMDAAFLMDTGANRTIMNRDFYERAKQQSSPMSPQQLSMAGVGGSDNVQVFRLPLLGLKFDSGAISLHNVMVLPKPSQFDVPGTIGNMGRDVILNHANIMIDFQKHRLIMS